MIKDPHLVTEFFFVFTERSHHFCCFIQPDQLFKQVKRNNHRSTFDDLVFVFKFSNKKIDHKLSILDEQRFWLSKNFIFFKRNEFSNKIFCGQNEEESSILCRHSFKSNQKRKIVLYCFPKTIRELFHNSQFIRKSFI